MSYVHSYFIANIGMLLVWILFFYSRKDVRKQMLLLSIAFGFGGLFCEYIYTVDWWRPLTITGTRVGIEDFLFGFWIAGVSTAIYEEFFRKTIYLKKNK